jgi:hypothetical protein
LLVIELQAVTTRIGQAENAPSGHAGSREMRVCLVTMIALCESKTIFIGDSLEEANYESGFHLVGNGNEDVRFGNCVPHMGSASGGANETASSNSSAPRGGLRS